MVDERIKWPAIGMTLDEAAEALRVDPKTLRTLIKAGDFPARKVGKGYRIDWDAVKQWLANSKGQAMEDEV